MQRPVGYSKIQWGIVEAQNIEMASFESELRLKLSPYIIKCGAFNLWDICGEKINVISSRT
jgi:hypothetical protein